MICHGRRDPVEVQVFNAVLDALSKSGQTEEFW